MTKRTPPYSPEVRERAVRMVFDHRDEYARCEEDPRLAEHRTRVCCHESRYATLARIQVTPTARQAGPAPDEIDEQRLRCHQTR
jgi:hypothetical protein